MDLSILILTHNRPKLFNRCLESLKNIELNTTGINYEILVNNDSDDISISNDYKLYNKKSEDLSDLYYLLYKEAKGKYIYFLEDDDIILKPFCKVIKDTIINDYDLVYCNFFKVREQTNGLNLEDDLINFNIFKNQDFFYNFQLSRCIFKKSKILKFPRGNNIFNDYILFKNIDTEYIKTYKSCIYKQTIDGNDNISYESLNKDSRFKNQDSIIIHNNMKEIFFEN